MSHIPYPRFPDETETHYLERACQSALAEVATLQARVAELEADQSRHLEAIASEARCLGHLRTNLDEKQTRIAQAVAELEKEQARRRSGYSLRALAILKGEA